MDDNLIKMNWGCGNSPMAGYVNIDKSETAKADLFLDVTKGMPTVKDGTVETIHSGCMLEQLTPDEFMFVVNEAYRILRDGGTLEGYVPSIDPRVLHLDPMDKMFFQEDSFKYLCKNEHHWAVFGMNYGFRGWSSYDAKTNESGIIFFTLTK